MGTRALISVIAFALTLGTFVICGEVYDTHHRVRRQLTASNSTSNETAVTNSSLSNETTTTANTSTTPISTSASTTTISTSTTKNNSTTKTTSKPTNTTKTTTDSDQDTTVVLKRFACTSLNKNHLEKCCDAPILDFFTHDQKMACNSNKNIAKLFSSTKDYFLHQFQDRKTNTIDFGSASFEKKFGKTACFMQCLFKDVKAFANGEIDDAVLGSYLSENLSEEWATTITEAVATCKSGASEVLKKTVALRTLRVTKECSTLPAMVMQCIIKNINTHCPESAKVVSPACSKTRASFEVCNEFAETEIDTSRAQRAKETKKMVIKVRGAVNVINKKNKDPNKVKVIKSQSISTRTTPYKLINAA